MGAAGRGSPRRRSSGDPVVLREIWHGRIFEARPAVVVRDEPELQMFYLAPGARSRAAVRPDGSPLRLPELPTWQLEERVWGPFRVLSFAFPDTPYAVLASWEDASDEFRGWYVNLQEPLRPSPVGFDTTDHALDVLVSPNLREWSWKDEDDLARAVALGLFTAEEASGFRRWGQRAVDRIVGRESPFDREWEAWRPDPDWGRPELPLGWDLEPA